MALISLVIFDSRPEPGFLIKHPEALNRYKNTCIPTLVEGRPSLFKIFFMVGAFSPCR